MYFITKNIINSCQIRYYPHILRLARILMQLKEVSYMGSHSRPRKRKRQHNSTNNVILPLESIKENPTVPSDDCSVSKTKWNNGTTEICSKNCFLYLTPEEMMEVLKNNTHCSIGSVSSTGQPHIATTMCSYSLKEDTLYFYLMINVDSQTANNIRYNPYVNIYIMESYHQKHCKNSYRTISAEGRATIILDSAGQDLINTAVVSRNKACKMYMNGCMYSENAIYLNVEISSVIGKKIIF